MKEVDDFMESCLELPTHAVIETDHAEILRLLKQHGTVTFRLKEGETWDRLRRVYLALRSKKMLVSMEQHKILGKLVAVTIKQTGKTEPRKYVKREV